jgi:hypothetical protein
MTPELQQVLGVLIGILALLASLVRMELLIRHAEAQRKLADIAAEQARLERELAQAAATEVRTLGAALGAGTVSGALAREGEG